VRSTNKSAAIHPSSRRLLADLWRGGVLTEFQARCLAEHWGKLSDDWASSPYFHQLREHTRAYIDRERHQEAPSQRKQEDVYV
jgi:hypothetical protein